MPNVKFTDLKINPDRQRKEFKNDTLIELANSIKDRGLLQAPVVRADGVTLVAGERRCKAMYYLHHEKIPFSYNGEPVEWGTLPVVSIADMEPDEIEEAELHENLRRVDLTWQESAAAIARLTEMRRAADPSHTPLDTAKEITTEGESVGTNYGKAREAEMLRDHLDDPDVQAAKSPKDAIKVIRKKLEKEKREKLAAAHQETMTPHTIINGDMREELVKLPDSTYAVLITDPPYGVDADKFGEQADAAHEYEDSIEYALELVGLLAEQSYRVCKDEAHAYVFCDIRHWPKFSKLFEAAGWYVWQTPLLWAKTNGMLPRPEHGPRRCYEAILYAIKGDRKVNAVFPDIVAVPNVAKPVFGAQKPSDLYKNLLQRSALPGDKVLDTFAGAGPILQAADDTDCIATAIEMNPEKYNYILANLEEEE